MIPSGLSYYLGAAIDLSTTLNPFDVMTDKVIASDPDCVIFRPESAYRNAHKTADKNAKYLKSVNDHALLSADVAVFYLTSNVFSMGAALEIQERAKMHDSQMVYSGGMRPYSDRIEKVRAYDDVPEYTPKKTLVITDKAGLYLKVQKSRDLTVHLLDGKKLEETDIGALIKEMYSKEA